MARIAPILFSLGCIFGCDPESGTNGSESKPTDTGTSVEDPQCERYPDVDGDGHGEPSVVSVDCAEPGFVDVGDDCDDNDPDRFPGAPERCNDIDDDCDGEADDALVFDWYVDADADGFGSGDSINDCDPPEGFVDNNLDCLDTHPGVHPDAAETCNGIDDNCNELVDDDDPEVDLATARTWYADGDGDGYGDPDTTVAACDAPDASYVDDGRDCDDANADFSPDAAEICDGLDNDCDGDIDDDDANLDASTTGTAFFPDVDGDGFGDEASPIFACELPEGLLVDGTDCNDGDFDIHPDATEVCDLADNDCDGDIDDADPDVDVSTGMPTYADTDSDGYGDAATAIYECAASSGRTTDATDCDDSVTTINPAATEICDTIDNDCDGDIDDDDASLDTSTGETWYRDADSDGLGDASSTTLACELPSGYADNPDDCDDSGFDDYDGDLLQDCEDPDADGDGLSNTYDVDDLDDSLVRGPTGGWGGDGALAATGTTWSPAADHTALSTDAVTGDSTLVVDDASLFSIGDELLLLNSQGTNAGTFAFHFVTATGSTGLTIEPPLTAAFDADDTVQVIRVPHYTTVSVSGSIAPEAWDGAGGGALVFRATGSVSVSGSVDASGAGYLGGAGVSGNAFDPTTGGSHSEGPVAATTLARRNDGGGGARVGKDDAMTGGGGGAYGTDGGEGESSTGAHNLSSGAAYGDGNLAEWFFGSGGGGGSPDTGADGMSATHNASGDGGAGGGLVAIYSADAITVGGSVVADGADGIDGWSSGTISSVSGDIGGGGGGAGGQILLSASTITITGIVEALGGAGGIAWSDEFTTLPEAGDGGDGRIRLEYTALSGLSNVDPTPSTGTYTD